MLKLTGKELINAIKGGTVFGLDDLVKACEEESVTSEVLDSTEEVEEKTEFDVELTEAGPNKAKVLKIVCDVTRLGLPEGKGIVDSTPKMIKKGVSKEEAEDIKAKLEAVGAIVTLE